MMTFDNRIAASHQYSGLNRDIQQETPLALSHQEWQRLSEFGLTDCHALSPRSIATEQLLDDTRCLEVLAIIQAEIGAPDLKVTASLVIKRIGFLTLAPMLSAMSWYDKGLDMSMGNCIFEYPFEQQQWQSRMPLKNCQVTHADDDRVAWREALLSSVFKHHLSLLVMQFHRLTRVPQAVLWENIAVRVFSIYERRILPALTDPTQRSMAQADFTYLLQAETAQLFGLDSNPLTRYFYQIPVKNDPVTPIRVRRTCCYYYKVTDPAKYCSTCPLVGKKPSARGCCGA
ncbi:MAG: IucA/IucC family C-terminal-domain containing protein [Vibrio sp.]